MKHAWTFGQQLMLPVVSDQRVTETLIEYDGPQLRILEKGADQFLALRIDEDGAGVRWLEAPITSVVYSALMAGELALRNALLKPDVILVENSHAEETVHVWQLDPAQIPEQVLPKRGAMLPRFVRALYKSDLEPGTPAEFHLGTKNMRGSRIAFSRLSQITSTIQNLWDSIASAGAQRTRHATKPALKKEPERKTITLDGYLEGFARKKRYFEFYEDGTGRLITGKIHKSLRDVPLHDEVRVGHRRKHRAEIESVIINGEEKFTLIAFSAFE